jgi:hypothetical protein
VKTLTRDEILSADDLTSERVKVPEWGGEVIVRALTGTLRDAWETSMVSADGKRLKVDSSNVRAKLVAVSVVDDKGKRVFTDKDVIRLGNKSAAALERVVDVAKRLSAIGEDELEAAGKG